MAGIDIISDSTGKEIVSAILSTDVTQDRISEINEAAELKKNEINEAAELKKNEILESIPEDYRNIVDDVSELKGDIDYHFEKPLNYDYLTSHTPLDGVKGFNASGVLNNFSGLAVFVTKVEENTEYKLSYPNDLNETINLSVARILYSANCNAKVVGETVSGIIEYSDATFDTTFTTPTGTKYVYIGIADSRFNDNLTPNDITMQKITTEHPQATYPIGNDKLANTDVDVDLNKNETFNNFKEKVENEILSHPYPFAYATDNINNIKLRRFIKDIELYGFDKNSRLSVVIFRKILNTNNFLIQIQETDESGVGTGVLAVQIDKSHLNQNQLTGYQQCVLKFGNRWAKFTFDMEYYQTLNVLQTQLTYDIGGLNDACYKVPSYEVKMKEPIPKDYPIITIIDDDGSVGFTNVLKPVLDTYGFKSTLAIVPTWIGSNENFMSLDTLKSVVSEGHDVLSHSNTHSPSIWYANGILTTNRQDRINECIQSRDWFLDNGFVMPQAIVYPSGGYNTAQKRIIEDDVKPYFDYGFTTEAGVMTDSPLHSLMLKRTVMLKTNELSYYTSLIDECIESSGWLVLFCHSNSSTEIDSDYLSSIFAYIQEKGVSVMRFSDAIRVKRNICSIGSWYREGSLYIGRDGTLKNSM